MSKRKKKHHNHSYKYLICPIKKAGIKEINYKDVEFLKQFLTENGKILPRRVSNVCAKNQRLLAVAIKKARLLSLLTFVGENIPRDDSLIQQPIVQTEVEKPKSSEEQEKNEPQATSAVAESPSETPVTEQNNQTDKESSKDEPNE